MLLRHQTVSLRHRLQFDAVDAALLLAVAVAVAVAIRAALRAGSPWLLTALAPWAVALAVCAVADAATQRVPTSVVRTAGVVVLIASACTAAARNDYRPLAVGVIVAVVAFGVVSLGWKYADVGRGDVRLAALGGLGLGGSTARGLAVGVFAFALIAGTHAAMTYARTRDRKARVPLGPALAVGFFTAAAF